MSKEVSETVNGVNGKLSPEQLGWFIYGGIQTEIFSRGASFDKVDFGIKKKSETMVEIIVSVGNHIKQAWFVSTIADSEQKVLKTALEIVDEIEKDYDGWVEEEEALEAIVERHEMAQAHYSADLSGIGKY